jgi:hypothetical protein
MRKKEYGNDKTRTTKEKEGIVKKKRIKQKAKRK